LALLNARLATRADLAGCGNAEGSAQTLFRHFRIGVRNAVVSDTDNAFLQRRALLSFRIRGDFSCHVRPYPPR
jgi:hypothetical protein